MPSVARSENYRLGLAAVVASTFCTSTAGVLLRFLEEADGWQVLFYRSIFFILTLGVFFGWRHGRGSAVAVLAIGRAGLMAGCFLALSFVTFIFALLETSVANVVFIVSGGPLFVAILAWVFLRERVRRATWISMVVALVGIAMMLGAGALRGTMFGSLLALVCCLGYAATLVTLRSGKAVDMLPATALAGAIAIVVSLFFIDDFAISGHDLAITALLGVVQLGIQYILITLGTRHVPAAEVALIGRMTAILAPLWAWIGVGEVPENLTLLGGAIVLGAVIGNGLTGTWSSLRRSYPSVPLSRSPEG